MLKKIFTLLYTIVLLTVSQASLQVSGNTNGIPILSAGNGAYPNALVVSTNGNIGIGITAPSTKLEVAGTVSVSALQVNGTANALVYLTNGADFAEYFDAENTWRAIRGDIVGINASTGLARLYQSGDAFAGIVSDKPGYIGNHQSPTGNQVLVGLVGQLDYNHAQTVSRQGRLYTKTAS